MVHRRSQRLLGYAARESIQGALDRAKTAASTAGISIRENFVRGADLGLPGAWYVSKYAAILMIMHANPEKAGAARAQAYFALHVTVRRSRMRSAYRPGSPSQTRTRSSAGSPSRSASRTSLGSTQRASARCTGGSRSRRSGGSRGCATATNTSTSRGARSSRPTCSGSRRPGPRFDARGKRDGEAATRTHERVGPRRSRRDHSGREHASRAAPPRERTRRPRGRAGEATSPQRGGPKGAR